MNLLWLAAHSEESRDERQTWREKEYPDNITDLLDQAVPKGSSIK
jgi:hypothetical protein